MSTVIYIGNREHIGGAVPPKRPEASSVGDVRDLFGFRLRRYRLSLALWVASIVMLFVGFSSAYVVRRGIPTYETATGAYSATWEPLRLPIGLLIVNTVILIAASAAIEMARRSAQRQYDGSPAESVGGSTHLWIHLTLLLGLGFLAGQGFVWIALRSDGHFMTTGARSAFFYVLTGTHALHSILGILAVTWIAIRSRQWPAYKRYLGIDLTAWYLHSMTVLWLYLFGFLIFA
jgi:cytochrome c oxidase subunit III